MKKRIRKPQNFGFKNNVGDTVLFKVSTKDGDVITVDSFGDVSSDRLWIDSELARKIAAKLIQAADYLDQPAK